MLGSVIIHEETWRIIDKDIIDFKKKLIPNYSPDEWELHASFMMDGRGFFKNFKKDDRFDLIQKTYEFIGNLQIKIIGVAIIKSKLRNKINLEEWGFRLLYERLLKYLEKANRISGKKEMGIVLIDSINKSMDRKRSDLFYEFMNNGTFFSTHNEYLVERPILSNLNIGI